MKTLKTTVVINAPAQTVWSVLDDIESYRSWNKVIPRLVGRTTVGEQLEATFCLSGVEPNDFRPVVTRVVGGREFRWMTEVPGEHGYRAEHYFILTPLDASVTHLEHSESFVGPMVDVIWPMMDTLGRKEYERMNLELKNLAEAKAATELHLHPHLTAAPTEGDEPPERWLRCNCVIDPVEIRISGPLRHNHLCGCGQCWKPHGAIFAQAALVSDSELAVSAHEEKLEIVDGSQKVHRYRCRECGVHMYGEAVDRDHHFYGIRFVHPELDRDNPGPRIEFAGFVSSIIEGGVSPTLMAAVRTQLRQRGIEACDAFSPEIMDLIAWHKIKLFSNMPKMINQ